MAKDKPKPKPAPRKMQGKKPAVPGTNVSVHKGAFCTECETWYDDQKQSEVNRHAH